MPFNSQFDEQKERVIASLIAEGVLCSQNVIRAMRTVPREEFVPEEVKPHSYIDRPLPIGYGQTISAIHMVSIMNEQCKLEVGQKILEVGSGCGYHACTAAEIVAPSNIDRRFWGHVYSIDVIHELVKIAMENIKRTGYQDRISVIHGDGSIGLPEEAPFDRIYVTAAAPNTPKPLLDQLKPSGILLIPVGGLHLFQSLLKYEKKSDGKITESNLGSVAFVPLRGKYGYR